jgi:RHS repeat-associated protein
VSRRRYRRCGDSALNCRLTATYADGSTVSYTFDLGERLTQVIDSVGGTVTRAYDGLDRLTSETSAQGTVTYTYDAANRLTSLQAPGQGLINYGYDNGDRLTSITQGTSSIVFAYDNASRRTSGTTPSGSWAYTYDVASQLTQIAYTGWPGASLGTLTYTYGLDGSVTSRSGTLFTSVLPAAVTSVAYNAANRLTSRVTSSGTQSPTWDANGSMTSDGLNAYTWDARNRLTTIGSLASFVYDAFGRRVIVTKSGVAPIGYLYSGDNVIQEQVNGGILALMLTGPGLDERYVRAGELVFTDLLGSTVALSNGSSIQTSYAYDPYGVTSYAGATTYNTYEFTGRENDGTTAGLMFYRARYYNPAWGRFVSEDPIGVLGGGNLYGYVGQQPTGWVDPSGHTAAGALAGAQWGGGIAGAAGIETGPLDVPIGLLGAGIGAAIGDWWTGPDTVYSKADKGPTEVAPKDCPSGTRPINKDPRIRRNHQAIKRGVGNGPKDWTGITPGGHIIITNPDGTAEDLGPYETFLP